MIVCRKTAQVGTRLCHAARTHLRVGGRVAKRRLRRRGGFAAVFPPQAGKFATRPGSDAALSARTP